MVNLNIINDLRRIKRLLKVTYYWMLCFFLSPKSKGLEPYKNEPLKYRLTKLIPSSKNSAVHLQITGKVTGVGFRAWLIRRARLNKLEGLAINRSKKRVEAVLIGSSSSIVKVIQEAWKGPPKAKVAKVKVKWFNMPVKRHLEGSSTNNQDINWSVETAELLRLNIDCLGAVMQNPNIFTEDEVYSNSGELAKAARKKNLFVAQLGNINYMVSPVKKLGFHQSQSSGVTTAIRSLTDNKQLTRKHLFKHGFPVPEGEMFTDYQPAQDYFFSCAKPVVVKPATGSYGKGITVDVTSIEDFETAWEHAKSYHSQVVIEKMFQGVDIRILVLGGKATAALMRVPAHVIGDGINTIESLIDSKNEVRMANPRLCKAPIAPDLHTESFLSRQGHSFSSVPYKGEVVFLNLKANIGAGADSIIVTDRIHQDLMSLAEKAVKTFGINHFWGVDMLVERIHRPRN